MSPARKFFTQQLALGTGWRYFGWRVWPDFRQGVLVQVQPSTGGTVEVQAAMQQVMDSPDWGDVGTGDQSGDGNRECRVLNPFFVLRARRTGTGRLDVLSNGQLREIDGLTGEPV